MKILFSSTPAFGHLIPMLPLAAAARQGGHQVAVATDASLAPVLGDLPLLQVGPDILALLAETKRRTGIDPLDPDNPPVPSAEFFGAVRPDLSLDEALRTARDFRPDLIVGDVVHYVSPLLAAALEVPWVSHGLTLALPDALTREMDDLAAERFVRAGLQRPARLAFIDPWPDALGSEGGTAPADRLPIRPAAHQPKGVGWAGATFADAKTGATVLVTLGTTVSDANLVQTILGSLDGLDVNVLVTTAPGGDADAVERGRSWVRSVGFVPLGLLLDEVDLVVSASGAGTVLGALSRGLPLVLLPMVTDQPAIAERVAAAAAGVIVGAAADVGPAVARVLGSTAIREAAAAVGRNIAAMPSPTEVVAALQERVHAR